MLYYGTGIESKMKEKTEAIVLLLWKSREPNI